MFAHLLFFMILVYITCIAGLIHSVSLILKPRNALVASFAATLFIICVITLYASTVTFIEYVQTDHTAFKLAVGGARLYY